MGMREVYFAHRKLATEFVATDTSVYGEAEVDRLARAINRAAEAISSVVGWAVIDKWERQVKVEVYHCVKCGKKIEVYGDFKFAGEPTCSDCEPVVLERRPIEIDYAGKDESISVAPADDPVYPWNKH